MFLGDCYIQSSSAITVVPYSSLPHFTSPANAKFAMPIAIIGGGPTGLACSIYLTRQGIPHTIYESAKYYPQDGAGVILDPAAMAALKQIEKSVPHTSLTLILRRSKDTTFIWLGIIEHTGRYPNCVSSVVPPRQVLYRDRRPFQSRSTGYEPNFSQKLLSVSPERELNALVQQAFLSLESCCPFYCQCDFLHSLHRCKAASTYSTSGDVNNIVMERNRGHRWLPAKKTSHTVFEAYLYPTPCDGILSNPDTDPHPPRMIAADGIEMHAFRRPCQRHNPLFLQDKDVLFQWVVAAPCSPRSLRKSA
jgi:hypothetical protein